MLTIILALLYVATFFLICRLFSRREGYYSTVAIFGIAVYIYYIGIPVEMSLSDTHLVQMFSLELTLTTAQLNQIIGMGLIAFLSFSIGYRISGFNPFKEAILGEEISQRRTIRYSVIFVWLASIVAIVLFFSNAIAAVSTYVGSYTTIYENPLFAFVVWYAVISTALIAATVIRKGRLRHLVLGIILVFMVILWGIYSSDKDSLLLGVLALGSCFIVWKMNRRFGFLVLMIFFVFLGILLFTMFNMYRGGAPLSQAFAYLSLSKFDPAGPFVSMAYVLNNLQDLKWGTTYTNVFTLLIPKALWAGRPLDLAEQFGRQVIPNWQSGQGVGFSLLAEAYINFSWLGAFIQYFFIGLLWGYFWRVLRRVFCWHYSIQLWQSLYITFGYYMLIIMNRGTVAGLFKSLILFTALFVLFAIVFDISMIRRKTSKLDAEAESLHSP
jgi:oligosaccharide repeat unit polymerase